MHLIYTLLGTVLIPHAIYHELCGVRIYHAHCIPTSPRQNDTCVGSCITHSTTPRTDSQVKYKKTAINPITAKTNTFWEALNNHNNYTNNSSISRCKASHLPLLFCRLGIKIAVQVVYKFEKMQYIKIPASTIDLQSYNLCIIVRPDKKDPDYIQYLSFATA